MFCKLKNGQGFVVFSDNLLEETMDLIPISDTDEYGNYNVECIVSSEYAYDDIEATDTNRKALGIQEVIMKLFIYIIGFVLIGAFSALGGLTILDWEYWGIIMSAVLLILILRR